MDRTIEKSMWETNVIQSVLDVSDRDTSHILDETDT